MTPNAGWVGSTTSITVTSTTFPIEGDYRIIWSSSAQFETELSKILKEGTAAKGTYTITESVTIPQAAWGAYKIALFRIGKDDPSNSTFITQFNVLPRLKVEPVSVSPGATVALNGTGFPANESVTLTFDNSLTSTNVSPNTIGTFSSNFIVPNAISGQHTIGASSEKLLASVAPATILIVPAITVEPKSLQPGTKVIITGHGFAANSKIAIKHNDLTITNSPNTDSTGNFSYSFNLPVGNVKSHTFVASDDAGHSITYTSSTDSQSGQPKNPTSQSSPPKSSNSKTANTATGDSAFKPATLEPKGQSFGILGSMPVNFIWSQVSGTGGVTYTLEIADNPDFSPIDPTHRVTGLTQTNFTMVLEPGKYYWRVKATDSIKTDGDWSYSLYSFRVGQFPTWIIAAGVIIYIILLCILIKTLLNRRNRYPYRY